MTKVNRREFIEGGVTVLVAAKLSGARSVFSPIAIEKRTPIYKAIYDVRFPVSVAFGDEARKLGLATHATRGDITSLWFNDLDIRWCQDKSKVVGLTSESALFLLELFARDHRMRVVFRGEHEFLHAGGMAHTYYEWRPGRRGLEVHKVKETMDWAPRLARVMTDIAADPPSRVRAIRAPLAPPRDDRDVLVSWMIAPV